MDKSNSKMYINTYGVKTYENSKGEYHRLDDPAFESPHGNKGWYKEGLCHRIDGPACEWSNGDKFWYLLHKEFDEKEFNSWIFRIKTFV